MGGVGSGACDSSESMGGVLGTCVDSMSLGSSHRGTHSPVDLPLFSSPNGFWVFS